MNLSQLRELNEKIEGLSNIVELLGKIADKHPDLRLKCLGYQTQIAHEVNELVKESLVSFFEKDRSDNGALQNSGSDNGKKRVEDSNQSDVPLPKGYEINGKDIPKFNIMEMLLRKLGGGKGFIASALIAFLCLSCSKDIGVELSATHADSMRAAMYEHWFTGYPMDTINRYFAFSLEDKANLIFVDSVSGKIRPPCDLSPDYCACMKHRGFFPESCK